MHRLTLPSLCLIFSPWIQSLSAVNYYIDSEAGNDSSSGVTEATAWKSLQQVQRTVYQPGDQILFKKGCSWLGQLSPQGSGKENAAIVIGSYGSGDLPKIKGNGSPYALGLKHQEYWEIRALDISNPASEAGERVGSILEKAVPRRCTIFISRTFMFMMFEGLWVRIAKPVQPGESVLKYAGIRRKCDSMTSASRTARSKRWTVVGSTRGRIFELTREIRGGKN